MVTNTLKTLGVNVVRMREKPNMDHSSTDVLGLFATNPRITLLQRTLVEP